MEIIYLGHSSFRISTSNISLVIDPFDPEMVGIKLLKVSSDIVLTTHDHKDHSRTDLVDGVKKIISGPGEYEIAGVSITGTKTFHDKSQGKERGANTVYTIEFSSLTIAHLGDLGHELSESQAASIGDVDILMIPVGGKYTIGPDEALSVIKSIEPTIIIPMHYRQKDVSSSLNSELEPVESFLSLTSLRVETMPKLTIKKGELLQEDQMIVVLERKK